jgi:hypothetical protein
MVINRGSRSPETRGIDLEAPTILARSTQPDEVNVAPTNQIALTFSESVRPTSISLRVLDDQNREVEGIVNYSEEDRKVTFLPQPKGGKPQGCCGQCSHCPLRPATTYRVTVSGAEDLAGNVMRTTSWSFTTSDLIANASLWNNTVVPPVETAGDGAPIEVGVKFQVVSDGYITGIRFYKGLEDTGIHVGHLWNEWGMPLATASFVDETESGWQQVNFGSPIFVSADTTFVASYYAPTGRYSKTSHYFGAAGISGDVIRVLGPQYGGGGAYFQGVGGAFPAISDGASNYWVDVVFSNVPLTVVEHSPERNVSVASGVSAVFSADIMVESLSFTVRDAGGRLVAGTVEYDQSANRATFRPTNQLSSSTSYSATVDALDTWGNSMTPVTWFFSTAG